MPSAQSLRHSLQTTSALSYLLAFILPVGGTWLTLHVHYFWPLPFAMHFIALAIIATLGGILPSILAVLIALLTQNHLQVAFFGSDPLPHYDVYRLFVVSLGAVIISAGRSSRLRSREKLEAALLDLQERTDTLVDSLHSSHCASWVHDIDGDRITHFYSGSYEIFGRPFTEIRLPAMASIFLPEDQDRLPELSRRMETSLGPIIFEYRCLWPNGETHTHEMRGTRVPGTRRLWRGITVDISERKLAEAALLRSEKLAAMGRLASTVAHEINNPLEAVTNLLYLARTDPKLLEPTRSYLDTAERELARLSNITRLTLGFVRTAGSSTLTPLASTVDEVLSIFEHRLHNRGIPIYRDFDPAASILIAPHELRQIATNLISNAADAVSSQPSPAITVRTLCCQSSAVLLIEDNGIGIPSANLQRIFEPFFSTKEEVGTGIGLWVTRELVERNSGTIAVESHSPTPHAPSTIFRVEFPLAAASNPTHTEP